MSWVLDTPRQENLIANLKKDLKTIVSRTSEHENMSDCVHPCPCGYWGNSQKACTCTPVVTKYQKRTSFLLPDHIDIDFELPRADYNKKQKTNDVLRNTPFQIYGRLCMEPIEQLAEAAFQRDSLLLRSLVQDIARAHINWSLISRPKTNDFHLLALSAALAELLASRQKQEPPSWTKEIGALERIPDELSGKVER